jgi:hypothetical protein
VKVTNKQLRKRIRKELLKEATFGSVDGNANGTVFTPGGSIGVASSLNSSTTSGYGNTKLTAIRLNIHELDSESSGKLIDGLDDAGVMGSVGEFLTGEAIATITAYNAYTSYQNLNLDLDRAGKVFATAKIAGKALSAMLGVDVCYGDGSDFRDKALAPLGTSPETYELDWSNSHLFLSAKASGENKLGGVPKKQKPNLNASQQSDIIGLLSFFWLERYLDKQLSDAHKHYSQKRRFQILKGSLESNDAIDTLGKALEKYIEKLNLDKSTQEMTAAELTTHLKGINQTDNPLYQRGYNQVKQLTFSTMWQLGIRKVKGKFDAVNIAYVPTGDLLSVVTEGYKNHRFFWVIANKAEQSDCEIIITDPDVNTNFFSGGGSKDLATTSYDDKFIVMTDEGNTVSTYNNSLQSIFLKYCARAHKSVQTTGPQIPGAIPADQFGPRAGKPYGTQSSLPGGKLQKLQAAASAAGRYKELINSSPTAGTPQYVDPTYVASQLQLSIDQLNEYKQSLKTDPSTDVSSGNARQLALDQKSAKELKRKLDQMRTSYAAAINSSTQKADRDAAKTAYEAKLESINTDLRTKIGALISNIKSEKATSMFKIDNPSVAEDAVQDYVPKKIKSYEQKPNTRAPGLIQILTKLASDLLAIVEEITDKSGELKNVNFEIEKEKAKTDQSSDELNKYGDQKTELEELIAKLKEDQTSLKVVTDYLDSQKVELQNLEAAYIAAQDSFKSDFDVDVDGEMKSQEEFRQIMQDLNVRVVRQSKPDVRYIEKAIQKLESLKGALARFSPQQQQILAKFFDLLALGYSTPLQNIPSLKGGPDKTPSGDDRKEITFSVLALFFDEQDFVDIADDETRSAAIPISGPTGNLGYLQRLKIRIAEVESRIPGIRQPGIDTTLALPAAQDQYDLRMSRLNPTGGTPVSDRKSADQGGTFGTGPSRIVYPDRTKRTRSEFQRDTAVTTVTDVGDQYDPDDSRRIEQYPDRRYTSAYTGPIYGPQIQLALQLMQGKDPSATTLSKADIDEAMGYLKTVLRQSYNMLVLISVLTGQIDANQFTQLGLILDNKQYNKTSDVKLPEVYDIMNVLKQIIEETLSAIDTLTEAFIEGEGEVIQLRQDTPGVIAADFGSGRQVAESSNYERILKKLLYTAKKKR